MTSYAVSPQATFTCPPCSIRYRKQAEEAAPRYTYCSVTSPKPQIICFAESAGINSGSRGEITTSTINPRKEESRIVHLETLGAGNSEDSTSSGKLLAVHEDGGVCCYAQNLEAEEWKTEIRTGSSDHGSTPNIRVEFSAVVSLEQARKTLLKSREDILATIGTGEEDADGSLLLTLTRPGPKRIAGDEEALKLQYFSIRGVDLGAKRSVTGPQPKLQELVSLLIPESKHSRSGRSQITLHAASGTLYQNAEGLLAAYDLTGSIPRLAYQFALGHGHTNSCLRLSPHLLAFSSLFSLSIVDLPYCSLQAERPLIAVHEATSTAQNTKPTRSRTTTSTETRLLSYFAPLDLLLALQGRKLLAIQLSTTKLHGNGSRKRKRDGLLVNSIGRGSQLAVAEPSRRGPSENNTKTLGSSLPSSSAPDAWSDQKTELDRLFTGGDDKGFERAFSSAVSAMTPIKDGYGILHSTSRSHVDLRKVNYMLSKIFSVEEVQRQDIESPADAPRKLKIQFFSPSIFDWLVKERLLTKSQVEVSLKHYGTIPFTARLATGAIIQALIERDPSFESLLSLLTSPVSLSSVELVHVLGIVTNNSEASDPAENRKVLTDGDIEGPDIDIDKMQITHDTAENLQSPSAITPDGKMNQRILRLTMKRLYTCPSSSIARALRKELSILQLRLLVDTLRMEIARSGWLSLYEDSLEAIDISLQDDKEMCFIAHLLNCVVDSIGTGGWILGTSISDDLTETADTIAYMKAEISAALEGIEEATYLKGMLGEILLCGKDSLPSSIRPPRPLDAQLANLSTKPMTIAFKDKDSKALPLGLKIAPFIPMTKVGAGGEVLPRSKRDIGMLKSKMVGKYSFERIVI